MVAVNAYVRKESRKNWVREIKLGKPLIGISVLGGLFASNMRLEDLAALAGVDRLERASKLALVCLVWVKLKVMEPVFIGQIIRCQQLHESKEDQIIY